MKQPRYTEEMGKNIAKLKEGKIGKYDYVILCLGSHPTAYVNLPKKHKRYCKSYEKIEINVHGGLTFSSEEIRKNIKKGWWIGWDYAHCHDYCGYYKNSPGLLSRATKKWTTEEIFKHVKDVIKQLEEIKDKPVKCSECGQEVKENE